MSTVENTFEEASFFYIPVDKIRPNPFQPRKTFDKFALEELAKSITQYGVLQPISVRQNGTSYELVTGERRLQASKLAGRETIPAIIVDVNDRQSSLIALIENIQRQDLNFIEEAEGFLNIINDYNFTQEELANTLGKSQSSIANKLRILRLSKDVKRILLENGLTERHARALLKIYDEDVQRKVLNKVITQGLTVKKTEELVDSVVNEDLSPKAKKEKDKKGASVKYFIKNMEIYTNTIKRAVDMMKEAGVDVDYYMENLEKGIEIKIFINKSPE